MPDYRFSYAAASGRFSVSDELGVELGWRWRPIEAVGLMFQVARRATRLSFENAAPAKVAGVAASS